MGLFSGQVGAGADTGAQQRPGRHQPQSHLKVPIRSWGASTNRGSFHPACMSVCQSPPTLWALHVRETQCHGKVACCMTTICSLMQRDLKIQGTLCHHSGWQCSKGLAPEALPETIDVFGVETRRPAQPHVEKQGWAMDASNIQESWSRLTLPAPGETSVSL